MTTTTMIDPAILDKMADVLEERGIGRYTLEDSLGRVCVLGAFNVACGRPAGPEYPLESVTEPLFEALPKCRSFRVGDPETRNAVFSWSDHEVAMGRGPQVIAYLRRRAKALRKKASDG